MKLLIKWKSKKGPVRNKVTTKNVDVSAIKWKRVWIIDKKFKKKMERERERERGRVREQWMIYTATASQVVEESRISTIAKLRKENLLTLLRRTQNYHISFGTFFSFWKNEIIDYFNAMGWTSCEFELLGLVIFYFSIGHFVFGTFLFRKMKLEIILI